MPSSAARSSPTYPAPKYGPTSEYGDCESGGCRLDARATCPKCDGHYCRSHVADHAHVGSAHPS
ncbi:hypothetical protein [uncultured Jatrophihabitans sp.]|uniref:hypothetical protein n=1 Tax=uncultured Jatrophihabitans sp. TaxID=1610747 RepID=UPI0035CA7D6E